MRSLLCWTIALALVACDDASGDANPTPDAGPSPDVETPDATAPDAAAEPDMAPTAPTARIDQGPAPLTNEPEAAFAFTADRPAAFECALDGAAPEACPAEATFNVSDGPHRLVVVAVADGLRGPEAVHAWTVDTAPPAPRFVGEPPTVSAATDLELAFECDDAEARFECATDAEPLRPCTSPWRDQVLSEGMHRARVVALDPAGNRGEIEHTWRFDRTAPETHLVATPPARTADAEATFDFSSEDADRAAFECRLDDAEWAECTPPLTVEVAAGPHRFEVRAVDEAGLADPSPARHDWTRVSDTPETRILGAPPERTRDGHARFLFEPPGMRFECALDGAPVEGCASPLEVDVEEGEHVLVVTAVDDLGRRDPTPAEARWTVDRTPPGVVFEAGPPDLSAESSAELRFAADEPEATTTCRLDAEAWAPCVSPRRLEGLVDGPHRFEVRAHDSIGNVSAPSAHAWTVDTEAPITRVTSRPPEVVSTPVRFTFEAELDATFECRVDDEDWAPCASPHRVELLAHGPHALAIRAIDAAGNVERVPQRVVWRVDVQAPETVFLAAPPAATERTDAVFELGPADASFECRLDEAGWRPCPARYELEGLADGGHRFEAIARDAVGNLDATPAVHRWRVDTRAPSVEITLRPPRYVDEDHVRFEARVDEPAQLYCALDGAPAEPCESPVRIVDLAEGEHVVVIHAVDEVGHASEPRVEPFEVDLRPPQTLLVEGPPAFDRAPEAEFLFGPPEMRYECRLDFAEWLPCAESHRIEGLAEGEHALWVRAIDRAGNVDATPASHVWVVDRTPPAGWLDAVPPAWTREQGADFTFSGAEPGLRFECSLDDTPYVACASPLRLDDLDEGPHRFAVRAVDAAGNTQNEPAAHEWTVDFTPPDAVAVTGWPGDRTVLLEWPAPAADVVGYQVSRADAPDGEFTPLHEGWRAPNEGEAGLNWYLDPRPNEETAWYRVEAIDAVDFRSPPGDAVEVTPTVAGRWEIIPDMPVRAWHAAALGTGKIIMWQSGETARLFDPSDMSFSDPIPAPSNKFCSGMTALADGRLLAVGGHESPIEQHGHRDWLGLPTAEIFDPFSETWTALEDMPGGPRWYPAVRLLTDGRAVVAGGIDARFDHPHQNPFVDVYDPATNTWETVLQFNGLISRTFPRSFPLADGRLAFVGGQRDTQILNPAEWGFVPAGTRTSVGRGGGAFAVELPDQTVLYLGGGGGHASAEIFDKAEMTWRPAASMEVPRIYPNALIMSDGRPLVTGGRNRVENVRRTQLYDFPNDAWLDVGDHNYTHEYHSILLPIADGRVIAAGDQLEGEMFHPWYLEAGPRPSIEAAPAVVRYGEPFDIEISSRLPMGLFSMIRLGGVTHAINSDQHFWAAAAVEGADGLFTLSPPDNAHLYAPGYYMLWAHDLRGVPSEARYVRLAHPE